jgi:hypothetical protein
VDWSDSAEPMIQTSRAAKHWSAPADTDHSETAEHQRSTGVSRGGKVGSLWDTMKAVSHFHGHDVDRRDQGEF